MTPGRTPLLALTAAWNWLINERVPPRWYVPANLAAAAVSVGWMDDRRDDLASGAAWGTAGGAVVAGAVLVASRIPATFRLFLDERVDPGSVRHETLLRIPFGTVVLEEVLFRGLLPERIGHAGAAVAFGLWHVVPTKNTLDINGVTDGTARRRMIVAGVVATTLAAAPLSWLRRRSGSLLAPMLTHWAANAAGYALTARRRRSVA